MSTKFNQAKASYLKRLEQFVPIVDRVHGAHHPEFHDVRKIFNTIIEKTKASNDEIPNLSEEFAALQKITENYKVPSDVCESYEAVFDMLSKLDKAYQGDIA